MKQKVDARNERGQVQNKEFLFIKMRTHLTLYYSVDYDQFSCSLVWYLSSHLTSSLRTLVIEWQAVSARVSIFSVCTLPIKSNYSDSLLNTLICHIVSMARLPRIVIPITDRELKAKKHGPKKVKGGI